MYSAFYGPVNKDLNMDCLSIQDRLKIIYTHFLFLFFFFLFFLCILKKKIASSINENYNQLIGQLGRVFANGLGDLGSILSRVIPKTLKMVLDTSLLNTQQYKVYIKGKVEQSRERSSALPYTEVL